MIFPNEAIANNGRISLPTPIMPNSQANFNRRPMYAPFQQPPAPAPHFHPNTGNIRPNFVTDIHLQTSPNKPEQLAMQTSPRTTPQISSQVSVPALPQMTNKNQMAVNSPLSQTPAFPKTQAPIQKAAETKAVTQSFPNKPAQMPEQSSAPLQQLARYKQQLDMMIKQTEYLEKKKDRPTDDIRNIMNSSSNNSSFQGTTKLRNNSQIQGFTSFSKNEKNQEINTNSINAQKTIQATLIKENKDTQSPTKAITNSNGITNNTTNNSNSISNNSNSISNNISKDYNDINKDYNERKNYDLSNDYKNKDQKKQGNSYATSTGAGTSIPNRPSSEAISNTQFMNRYTSNLIQKNNNSTEMRSFSLESTSYVNPQKKQMKEIVRKNSEDDYKIKKLEDSLKKMEESKEYYRDELFQERKRITELEKQHQVKLDELRKEMSEIRRQCREEIEQTNLKHEQELEAKDKEYESMRSKHQENINTIKNDHECEIKKLQSQIQANKIEMARLIAEMNNNPQIVPCEQPEPQSTEEIKELFNTLAEKQLQISELNNQLNNRNQHIELMNSTFAELKAQIQELRNFKNEVEIKRVQNFDEILMVQIRTISSLKQEIEMLNEKINEQKLNVIDANKNCESLINEMKIKDFKHKADFSNMKTQLQIKLQNMENNVSNANKKLQTVEEKLKFSVSEVKKKDEFVKQYLVGRATTTDCKDHIEFVLAKYQEEFSESKEQQLVAELDKLKKQLELYEKYVK